MYWEFLLKFIGTTKAKYPSFFVFSKALFIKYSNKLGECTHWP